MEELHHANHHYVLQVPGSLIAATGPGITGCTYQSQDGEFNVEAAEQTDNQTLDQRMAKEIDLLKGTVTDQKKGDNWFALTGVTSDGTEYYRLHYTNGAQWYRFGSRIRVAKQSSTTNG